MMPASNVNVVLLALCFSLTGRPTTSLSPVLLSSKGHSELTFAGRQEARLGRYQKPTKTNPLFLANFEDGGETERRLLGELTELTEAFAEVQSTVKTNAVLYKDAIDKYQSDIDDLGEELRASQKSIAEKEEAIKELEISKNRLSQVIESNEEQGKQVEALVQEEAGVVSVLEEERDRLQSELATKDKETSEWNTERTRLLKEKDDMSGKIKSLQDEIQGLDSLQEELRASQKSIAEKEKAIMELECSKNRLSQELESNVEQGKQVEALVQEEAGVVSALEEERDRLESELATKEKGTSEWSTERARLAKEKDDMLEKIASLQDEIQRQASSVRSDMTKKYIDARAVALKEKEELRKQAEVAAKVTESEMQRMEDRIELYESERNSLRKLSLLAWRRLKSGFGWKRVKSLFGRKRRG